MMIRGMDKKERAELDRKLVAPSASEIAFAARVARARAAQPNRVKIAPTWWED